jgi:hypothetical protein
MIESGKNKNKNKNKQKNKNKHTYQLALVARYEMIESGIGNNVVHETMREVCQSFPIAYI